MARKKVILTRRISPPPALAVDRIDCLQIAVAEAKGFLDGPRYEHAVDLVKRLRDFCDREKTSDLNLKAVENFFEISDKGGVLGKINLRIFFAYYSRWRTIVILGVWKKEVENQTPAYIKERMKNRMNWYEHIRNAGNI